MTSFKRPSIVGASFGIGFVVAAIIIGAFVWYKAQPKPWNNAAIAATFDDINLEGKDNTFVFYYTLQNNTDSDFTLYAGSDLIVMMKLARQKSLARDKIGDSDLPNIDSPIFLPPRQRLRIGIHMAIPYDGEALKEGKSSEERKKYQEKLKAYVAQELSNLEGFTIFDKRNRLQIEFPKGW